MTLTKQQRWLFSFLALAILLTGCWLVLNHSKQPVFATTYSPPRALNSLNTPLLSADGSITLAQQQGKFVILYVGYTNCPNICPTTLATMKAALQLLPPEQASQVQLIFLTVDPARDTPERLKGYAGAFNPTFIGVTAAPQDLEPLLKEIGASYKIGTPEANGYYSVDHSTSTTLLDREGRLFATWSYGTTPAQIANDLKLFLR